VLLLLANRRGELVSKEELLATIWPDTHVEESNLPVMISAIRRAIGDDGRTQKYIQTVSKRGYRFVGDLKETHIAEPEAPAVLLPSASDPENSSTDAVPLLSMSRYPGVSMVIGLALAAVAVLFSAYWLSNGGSRVVPVLAAANGFPPNAAEMWVRKGRYAWNLQTKAGFLQSIEYFQKAIAEDAGDAAAYAGLAESYALLPSYSERNNDEERRK